MTLYKSLQRSKGGKTHKIINELSHSEGGLVEVSGGKKLCHKKKQVGWYNFQETCISFLI